MTIIRINLRQNTLIVLSETIKQTTILVRVYHRKKKKNQIVSLCINI